MFKALEDKPNNAPYSDAAWATLLKDYYTFRLGLVRRIISEINKNSKNIHEIKVYGFEPEKALALYAAGNIDLSLFYLFQMARNLKVDLETLFTS
ncbi:MAG: hypothetical protein IID52_08175 [Proteobacteria bacterium]|nr:hypothetical protein [Pseudomonadota bacterium]MCH8323306.1 hypothetical protein [Pseudomonadota bacterium]